MGYVMLPVFSRESPGALPVVPLEVAFVRHYASVVTFEGVLAVMGRQAVPFVPLSDRKFGQYFRD